MVRHKEVVKAFLFGQSRVKAVRIVDLMYHHRNSFPSTKSMYASKRNHLFSSSQSLTNDIRYARPAISIWSLRLVGKVAHKEILKLGSTPMENGRPAQFRAGTNGRAVHGVGDIPT